MFYMQIIIEHITQPVCKIPLKSIQALGCYRGLTHTLIRKRTSFASLAHPTSVMDELTVV